MPQKVKRRRTVYWLPAERDWRIFVSHISKAFLEAGSIGGWVGAGVAALAFSAACSASFLSLATSAFAASFCLLASSTSF